MEIFDLLLWWPIVGLLFIWMLYKFLTWNHDYWEKRGVPYLKPLPLLGNTLDSVLGKKSIGEVYEDIYWKLDGHKYGGIFMSGQPTLFIRDPEVIKDILVRDFTSFHDNNIFVDINVDPMFGRNPFVVRGDRWKVTRSQLMPTFTVAKLKPLFPLVEEVCQELKKVVKESSSGEFEVKELCSRFTTDVVATCAFGINGNSIRNPDSEFRQMGRDVLDPTTMNKIKFMAAFLFPWLANLFRIRFISKKVENFFSRMVRDVITYRKQKNVTRNDYIQHLIGLMNKAGDSNGLQSSVDKYGFEEIDVAAHAVTFFLDGFETSSSVFAFALYALARNPDVQSKVRDEVNAVLKEQGGQLSYDGIMKMTYLDMVFSETLRLYPPVMFLSKVCSRPTMLETPSGKDLQVEVGTPALIPVYAVHRDPKLYPDPEVFNPEHFSEESKKNRHKYSFLGFGEGPRICLGMRFAHMQVKAGIASIISNFEVHPTSRTPIPFVPDPTSFLLAAKGGLWLEFRAIK